MGREGAAVHGVRIVYTQCRPFVGSVCVGGTALMCRGRECARLGSATRKVTYQAFFWVLIDLIIELLDLIIKGLDNQTDIFIDLCLIIKPFDNQSF